MLGGVPLGCAPLPYLLFFVGCFLLCLVVACVVAFRGWVNSDTGLPCFKLEGQGRLETGGRVVYDAEGGVAYVADLFAAPGVNTVYTFNGQSVALKRAVKTREGGAVFGSSTGLLCGVDLYEGPEESVNVSSGAREYDNGVVRFGHVKREGGCRVWVDAPDQVWDLLKVLESPGLVSVALSEPALGVPQVRCVLVTKASVERVDARGGHVVDVSWIEKPFPVLRVDAFGGGFSGASATWDSATRLGFKWVAGWSYESLLKRLGAVL